MLTCYWSEIDGGFLWMIRNSDTFITFLNLGNSLQLGLNDTSISLVL